MPRFVVLSRGGGERFKRGVQRLHAPLLLESDTLARRQKRQWYSLCPFKHGPVPPSLFPTAEPFSNYQTVFPVAGLFFQPPSRFSTTKPFFPTAQRIGRGNSPPYSFYDADLAPTAVSAMLSVEVRELVVRTEHVGDLVLVEVDHIVACHLAILTRIEVVGV